MKFNFKVIFILILALSLVVFTGCSQNEEDVPEDLEESTEVDEPVGEVEEPQESESKDEEETTNGDEPVSSEPEESVEEDIMTDSGTYIGQVDNNYIEIKISGVPLEIASKVFIVDEDIKNTIEEEIKEEDQVKFEYYLNEDDVGVIVNIEKIVN